MENDVPVLTVFRFTAQELRAACIELATAVRGTEEEARMFSDELIKRIRAARRQRLCA